MIALDSRETPFGTLQVAWSERLRAVTLYHGGFLQSRSDRTGISLADYIHAMYGLAVQRPAGRALILGCGGGNLATMLARSGWSVTLVDIIPATFDLARSYFALAPSITCVHADGFHHLSQSRASHDLIVADMFLGDTAADFAAAPQFLTLARRRLRPGGMILSNIILYGDDDPRADRAALAARHAGLDVRLLDGRGAVGRNAVLAAGAVRGLRRPRLILTPERGGARLALALEALAFRAPSARRARLGQG